MAEVSKKQVYPGKSPYEMLPVETCVAKVLEEVNAALPAERVPIAKARGRRLCRDAFAAAPIPAFPASIMDGFAVHSADGSGRFPVDQVAGATAGALAGSQLEPGFVRYVTTGAAVPLGADAVVKVEDTKEVWEDDKLFIDISVKSKPGANIRQVGSDTAAGSLALRAGTLVGAGEIGLMAALGIGEVEVSMQAVVAVLSTGDELLDDPAKAACCDLTRGQIVDCNRPMLGALVEESGATFLDMGIVMDDYEALRSSLLAALSQADIVITSGGVSRGSKDHMKSLLSELGSLHFGEMRMKPGKPTTFATVPAPGDSSRLPGRPRSVFALPGNPVSCYVTFKLMVIPALERLHGAPSGVPTFTRVDAELAGDVEMDPVRPEYHRAVARWANGRIIAESTGFQRSSRVASVAGANCLLEIPAAAGSIPKGSVVKALLLPGEGLKGEDGFPKPAKQAAAATSEKKPSTATESSSKAEAQAIACVTIAGDTLGSAAAEGLRASLPTFCQWLGYQIVSDASQLSTAVSSFADSKEPRCAAVLVLLGHQGLAESDALTAEALRQCFDVGREAPNVSDLMLRTALPTSPLSMLSPLVAGYRNGRCLIASVPAEAGSDCSKALLELLKQPTSSPA